MITIKFSDNIDQQYNSFGEILKLDNYNDIIYIWCVNNSLSSLPELPDSLKILYCNENNLTSLPELPDSLTELHCYYNKLYNLPNLPNSLTELDCYNNNLYSLPELPNSLTKLDCANNNLSSLPDIPNSLTNMTYENNPIHIHIKQNLDGDIYKYYDIQNFIKRKFSNKIGNWFLDCKYNPKYLYCRKRLIEEYEELYDDK